MGQAVQETDKTIVYLGAFDFPQRNAAANLVLSTAELLADSGYRVVICGRPTEGGRSVDTHVLDGVQLKLRSQRNGRGVKYNPIALWHFYRSCLKAELNLSAIIAYNMPAAVLAEILVWGRKRHIPVIAHCTEWYANVRWRTSPATAPIRNLDTFLRMRILHWLADGLLVSSRYLAEYYRDKPTLALPTLSANIDTDAPTRRSSTPQIVYAGTPFGPGTRNIPPATMKDRLDLVIELLNEARQLGAHFRFDVFGLDRHSYLAAVPRHVELLRELGERVVFQGRVSPTAAATAIKNADYTIIIRDPTRVTLAGFPTKFTESVVQGTPVLANPVGEITQYLRDGVNGYLLPGGLASAETIVAALRLTPHERAAFKVRCLDASWNLSPEAWREALVDFIGQFCTMPERR